MLVLLDGLLERTQELLGQALRHPGEDGHALDDAMKARINKAIEAGLSRRFLPNEIFAVAEIPRTLSGKKQELPIKKLLLGQPIDRVINRDAMANPGCLGWYEAFAKQRLAKA